MKYRLFVSDYDGTLGEAPFNSIDDQTMQAINEYEKRGGKFVICSGRVFFSLKKVCDRAGFKGLVVSLQGACIQEAQSEKYLFNGGISTEKAIMLANLYEKEDAMVSAYIDGLLYYQKNPKFQPHLDIYCSLIEGKPILVDSIAEKIKEHNKPINQVCAIADIETISKLTEKYSEMFKNDNLLFNSAAKIMMEGVNKECSKGAAIKFLAKHFNVKENEIIAIGDSNNDYSLLNGEWHGVAVGDGDEELKKIAKEITVPYKDKPVLKMLKKYCLD